MQEGEACGIGGLGEILLERKADSKPRRDQKAGLCPAEDPGNGAQIGEFGRGTAARGTGADLRVFQLGHRSGLLKIGEDARVLKNVAAIVVVGDGRELVEDCLPLRLENPGEVALGVARVGASQGVERSRNHELKVAFGQDFVSIFEVENFTLLGDAQLAVEGVHGLGEDGPMRGTAAAANRSASTMKETQLDAGLAGDNVEIAVSPEDFPGAGQHAAVFV